MVIHRDLGLSENYASGPPPTRSGGSAEWARVGIGRRIEMWVRSGLEDVPAAHAALADSPVGGGGLVERHDGMHPGR